MVPTHPTERYEALLGSAPYLSRDATPLEEHLIGARKRHALGTTILSQPCRRRVSIESLNRKGRQLTAPLGGEPGPTPAGMYVEGTFIPSAFVGQPVDVDQVGDLWISDSGAACHMSNNVELMYDTRPPPLHR